MTKTSNTTQPTDRDPRWEHAQPGLSAPFPAKYVGVRPGAVSDTGQAIMLVFVDARTIMNRLDEVVGPENWSFTWQSVPAPDGRIAVHGQLKVYDVVKEDVGEAQDEAEPFKSAVSDAFKRCGVHFGLGRYLYSMPQIWWPYDKQKRRFANQEEQELFIETVVSRLIEFQGDTSRLVERELQMEAAAASGRSAQGYGESTPAQQERIRELQVKKFGATADARDRYDEFQRATIGRMCKRSELKKFEADKIIKALMTMPARLEEAA